MSDTEYAEEVEVAGQDDGSATENDDFEAVYADDQAEAVDGEQEYDEDGNPVEKAAEDDAEFIEVEDDAGVKHRVPKALEGAFMRNKDYTQKRQQDAEFSRYLKSQEAEMAQVRESIQRQAELSVKIQDESAQLHHINSWLEKIESVSADKWQELREDNPDLYDRRQNEWRIAQVQRDKLQKSLDAKTREFDAAAENDFRARKQAYASSIQQLIPEWNEEADVAATDYARSVGFADQELMGVTDARYTKVLFDASQAEALKAENAELKKQLAKRNKTASKPVDQPEAKPSAKIPAGRGGIPNKVTGKSRAEDNMSPEKWREMRRRQRARNNGF